MLDLLKVGKCARLGQKVLSPPSLVIHVYMAIILNDTSIQRPPLGRSSRFCVYFFSSSSCNVFLAWQQSSWIISPSSSGTAKRAFNRTLGLTLTPSAVMSTFCSLTMYRVIHLLANLGWVDFDFHCSTLCLVVPGRI